MITSLQLKVLKVLAGHIEINGNGPRLGTLHELMGGSKSEHPTKWSSVLRLLRKAGVIEWSTGDYASISITPKGTRALAGKPEPVESSPESVEEAPPSSRDATEDDDAGMYSPPSSRPVRELVSRPIRRVPMTPSAGDSTKRRRKRCRLCGEMMAIGLDSPCAACEPSSFKATRTIPAPPPVVDSSGHDLTLASLPFVPPAPGSSKPTLLRSPFSDRHVVTVAEAIDNRANVNGARAALDCLETRLAQELDAIRTTRRLLAGGG